MSSFKCKHVIPLVTDWQMSLDAPLCPYRDNEECHNPNRKDENGPCPFDEWAKKQGRHYTRKDAKHMAHN